MAIHSDNKASGQPTGDNTTMGAAFQQARGGQQQQQQGRPADQQQQQQQQDSRFSFLSPNSFSSIPLARGQASEVLIRLEKSLKELFEQADPAFETTLIGMDWNNNPNLAVSVLVVAVRYRDNPAVVAFTPLLLEGSVEPKDPVYQNINGVNTEILFTVGDAYNSIMVELVMEEVHRHFPQSALLPSAPCTVPRNFNLEDKKRIHDLAVNATIACSAELDQANPNFRDLNLKNAKNDASLVVRPIFGQQNVLNAVGLPIRADIVVSLTAEPFNNNNGLSNGMAPQPGRSSNLSQTCAFVDVVWSPQGPITNAYAATMQGNMYGAQQAPNFRRYLPRVVLTACVSKFGLTPASQLFSLISAAVLRQNNLWAMAFRRDTNATSGIDHRDIGALGIECNFQTGGMDGTRVNTKATSFTEEQRQQFITALIEPTPIMSIDVEEAGADTWATGIFAAVAENQPDEGAYNALIQAGMTLTDGRFERHFPMGSRIATDEDNRIHCGYFYDEHGVERDLREVDYLYVLNQVGDKDPEIVRQFSDTFFPTAPLLVRLAKRKSIIEKLVDRPVFTGYARRVTFEQPYIDAILKGCEELQLQMKTIVPHQDMTGAARATGDFAGVAMAPMQSTLFNRYSGGNPQSQTFGGNRQFYTGKANW